MVPGDASYVTKSEFNAALALLALSQKNVGMSLSPLFVSWLVLFSAMKLNQCYYPQMYLFTACHDIEMVNNHVNATTTRGEGMDINIRQHVAP